MKENITINAQKYMSLTILYFTGKAEKYRCVTKVCNLRTKYLYFEQAFDLSGKGKSIEFDKIKQWRVSL